MANGDPSPGPLASGGLLLVHSPVVGPSTWSRFAEVTRTSRRRAAIADLTPAIGSTSPMWPEMVRRARMSARGLPAPVTILGHSASGALLPGIGAAMGARLGALIFVDAVLPPRSGAHRSPPDQRSLLDRQTRDGLLDVWLDWWPPDVVATLLPSPEDRETLRADMPRLPRSFYDEEIPVPSAWTDWRCGYVRLGKAYDDELERAMAWGWPTARLDSDHLGIFTDAPAVFEAVVGLFDD